MNGTCALDALPLSNFTHAMGSGVMIDEKGTWVAMSSGSRTYQGWAAWVKRGLKIEKRFRAEESLPACGPATF